MIVSTVEGRMRVRANRLKTKKIAESVQEKINTLPGVSSVRINPKACSIVVHFDASKVDSEDLEDQVVDFCTPRANGEKNNGKTLSKRANQATKVGMMATLATSLAYGFMGNKKQHVLYGKVFVAFAGMHMLKHSSRLLR